MDIIESIKEHFSLDELLFVDFETYFIDKTRGGGKAYSLKGKSYWEYILDERFHATGFSCAFDDGAIFYPETPDAVESELEELVEEVRALRDSGKKVALVAQNMQFDGSVFAWRYGLTFDFYFDTKKLNQCLNVHDPADLASMAEQWFPDDPTMRKGDELTNADGVKLEDFTQELHDDLRGYGIQDCNLLRAIFLKQMEHGTPAGEVELMNITDRAFVWPQFKINKTLMREVVQDEEKKINQAVVDAIKFCHEEQIIEVSPATFSSNPKYAGLLERFGLEVPTKISPTTKKPTHALGKTDPDYIRLQIKHPELAPLYKARELVKSTIAKSRAAKMIRASVEFNKAGFTEADMPMFLSYYGAKNTGRWSGGEGLNQQNLQRGSKHRLALEAPSGYMIGVNDLSNIELRVNLWFCEQNDLLAKFISDPGFDMYSDLASDIYKKAINKKDNPNERQIGKAGSLGLGYAMSWYGFQQYLAGGPLGMEPMFVDDSFAQNVKISYDLKHQKIVEMWNIIKFEVLPVIANGGRYVFGRNGCAVAEKDKITLPSGRVLHYPNTRVQMSGDDRGYKSSYLCDSNIKNRFGQAVPRRIWHGLIIENIIQATARDVLGYQMIITERDIAQKEWGWVVGSVHDEILALLRETHADEGFELMQKNMQLLPVWGEGIPLASEGGYAREYSK